jgi:hypothetical protein
MVERTGAEPGNNVSLSCRTSDVTGGLFRQLEAGKRSKNSCSPYIRYIEHLRIQIAPRFLPMDPNKNDYLLLQ